MTNPEPRPNLLRINPPGAGLSEEARLAGNPDDHPSTKDWAQNFSRELLLGSIYVSMRIKEAQLIDKAFQSALGKPDPHPQNSRDELIESLVDDYKFFGLASGRQHTAQLVRDFEATATAQAKAQLGPGR